MSYRIYPTFQEALKLTDATRAQWLPIMEERIANLAARAAREPTRIAYTASTISGRRGMIVMCIYAGASTNATFIETLCNKADRPPLDNLPPELTFADMVIDAHQQNAITITPVARPRCVLLSAAGPETVAVIESMFNLPPAPNQ